MGLLTDTIKDKIKQNQAKAEAKYKGASIRNANIALATEFGDEELVRKITTVAESVGDDPDAQKTISEFLKKSMEQDSKIQRQEKMIRQFQSGSFGDSGQSAGVPSGDSQQGEGFFPSSINIDGMTIKSEAGIRREKEIAADVEVEKQVKAERRKFQEKMKVEGKTLQGQLIQSSILWKEMSDITERQTGVKPGRAAGMINMFGKAAGTNPKVAEFVGDAVETATSLGKMAAPSARMGPEMISLFRETIMNEWSTEDEALGQMVSSMANSMIKIAATNEKEFPDGIDFEQVMEFRKNAYAAFRTIVGKGTFQENLKLGVPTKSKKSGKFKVGDTREKDGITYERQEDGTWLPKKS
jgi:hypothetical protein